MMFSKLNLIRPIRFFIALFACTFLLFSVTVPAAFATHASDPRQGETTMKNIEAKSFDVVESTGAPYDLKKTMKEANEGLNEVQGAADIDKMKRPENSQNAAPSVEQVVKKNLEKLQGKD